jgi:sulfate permease, SulP family
VTLRTAAQDRKHRGLARALPVVGWLPRYERRWLRGDLAAGIAVTALVVPKNLGYADIARVPLQNGLYAAAAGAIIYALFGTSRHISTGPSSSLAAVAGGAVAVTSLAGEQAAQLVAAIALATGLLFLLLALLRMGWIASFLSKAVVTGFLAVAGGLLASSLFDLGAHGVALVGDVPSGLPTPEMPDLGLVRDHYATVVIAAVALLLIGFSQTAGDARAFAARHRYRIDVDQESVAQGMANVGAGLFQGMPVSTSLSASSLNESAGARTQVASLVTGGLVLATLLVLAPLFSDLPKAVLGAVIIDAVVFGMIDVAELRRLYRVTRFDFWVAAAAIVGVLSAGVLAGVVIGVCLSLGWLVYVATRPPMPLLGRQAGTQVFRDLDENPADETFTGIAVLRMDGGLFFATAEALEERIRALAEDDHDRRALVLDLEGVNFIDSQGAAKVTEIHELTEADGVTLRLARVKPQVLAVLRADGIIDRIGADHIHGNVHRAVEAQLADAHR